MDKNWFAVYTRPRWEKKISAQLTKKDIENYCPMTCIINQWSDRKKKVYQPLFTCYVFVNITTSEMTKVMKTDGVFNFLHWLGKPAIIKSEEIVTIKKLMNEYKNIQVEKIPVHINDRVRISQGPLLNQEGRVISVNARKVKVLLPSLGYLMTAEVNQIDLEKIR